VERASPEELDQVIEGLLEIALVLSSLYFISRKMLFPIIGIISGIIGIAVAASGLLS
jgi:mannose/fructose/N-acetylgalactosamine-specific phosphotransferase system component IID